MKKLLSAIFLASALVCAARADETAKISNVHLCCDKCVKGVNSAVSTVPGVTAKCDKESGVVELTGADKATLQKAADALIAAGYFGSSSDVTISSDTGAKGEKVTTLKITGTHLCCGKCVKAVDKAVRSVPGVTGHTATKNAESFEVTGNFNDKDVFNALQQAGLTGKEAK